MPHHLITPQPPDSGAVRGLLTARRGRYRLLQVVPVGRSVLGREIWGVLLGHGPHTVLFAAATHAQEWITALVLLRLCEDMCRALTGDGRLCRVQLRDALRGARLVFVPVVNPDGVEIALHGPEAAGDYAGSVRALGGGTPGLWQANTRGVDLNHNFNAGWLRLQELERKKGITGPAPRQYGGPRPHSEPETRALAALCERGDFSHVVSLHAQGEVIYWSYGDRTPPQARLMAEVMAMASGYALEEPDEIASHGGFKDWFIETTGRPGFTLELGRGVNPLPLSEFYEVYHRVKEALVLASIM